MDEEIPNPLGHPNDPANPNSQDFNTQVDRDAMRRARAADDALVAKEKEEAARSGQFVPYKPGEESKSPSGGLNFDPKAIPDVNEKKSFFRNLSDTLSVGNLGYGAFKGAVVDPAVGLGEIYHMANEANRGQEAAIHQRWGSPTEAYNAAKHLKEPATGFGGLVDRWVGPGSAMRKMHEEPTTAAEDVGNFGGMLLGPGKFLKAAEYGSKAARLGSAALRGGLFGLISPTQGQTLAEHAENAIGGALGGTAGEWMSGWKLPGGQKTVDRYTEGSKLYDANKLLTGQKPVNRKSIENTIDSIIKKRMDMVTGNEKATNALDGVRALIARHWGNNSELGGSKFAEMIADLDEMSANAGNKTVSEGIDKIVGAYEGAAANWKNVPEQLKAAQHGARKEWQAMVEKERAPAQAPAGPGIDELSHTVSALHRPLTALALRAGSGISRAVRPPASWARRRLPAAGVYAGSGASEYINNLQGGNQ